MNTRTPFDTGNSCCTANNDQIVDHLLGNAYQVVKFVAMRMPYIKTLSDNIDKLIAIADSLDKLNALQAKLPELLALREKLTQLMALYDHLDELLLISSNMTPLLTLYDNLDKINTLYTNIVAIQTVAQNIQAVLTVHNNIAAILNVNTNMAAVQNVDTNMASVKAVSTDMTSVKTVATNIASVNNVSTNMATIKAVEAKLPELSNISTNLDAALADNTAFKSATGSSKIGHTPTTGGATTVEAELKAIRTLAAGKQNPATTLSGYGITDAYTKTEADGRYAAKSTTLGGYGITDGAQKTAVVGGGGDPAAKTGRALATYVTSPATRPVQHSVLVAAVAGGAIRFVITCRKASGQPEVVLGAYEFTASGAGNVVGASAVVPAGWEVKVDATNATLNSWTEF
ncbi:hypothetical protein CNR35_00034 [Pseudomonas phage inbricus]|uniref:Uncharacterized protein n=2 Tax=Inbricusvirus inbricus TaxID=2845970 RepID=A0A514CUM1_9CAUD|nr:appendage [Pseudomonas phage inbricus]ATW58130.1 hypothetical protein CNR35_00034 [Pseudomonas phage inbricus]QDH84173.1 hypothetical protein Axy13_065 [Achromobacter phage vB_AxyP_19-32_Axy13]